MEVFGIAPLHYMIRSLLLRRWWVASHLWSCFRLATSGQHDLPWSHRRPDREVDDNSRMSDDDPLPPPSLSSARSLGLTKRHVGNTLSRLQGLDASIVSTAFNAGQHVIHVSTPQR